MKTRKIINTIIYIITGLLFLLTITVLIIGIRAAKRDEVPVIFGYTYSVVDTESMMDYINPGDLVFTKAVDFSEIKADDDIILFYAYSKQFKKDIPIIHRVIEINEDGSLRTKGDNNDYADDDERSDLEDKFVEEEKYIGKYIGKIPRIGNLARNYRDLLFGLIILVFIIVIIIEIKNIVKAIIEDRREKMEKEFQEKHKITDDSQSEDNKSK